MPVLKHAKKKLKQDKNRTLANKKKRSAYKELLKKARLTPTKEAMSLAFKAVDKAAKANILHDNKAARLKSALSKVAAGTVKEIPAKKKTTAKTAPKKVAAKKASSKKSPAKSK